MKKAYVIIQTCLIVCILAFLSSCNAQSNSNVLESSSSALEGVAKAEAQIGRYIVQIFEDSKGHLWFGTMEKGVARYDGKELIHFTTEDGLAGNAVVSITEDQAGNLWFGTHTGLSRYNGETLPAQERFTNFTTEDGLCYDRVANILIDSAGKFWIGSWGGVCLFDGTSFSNFSLPNPDVEIPEYQETEDWVAEIMEDSQGNIWFGRSGYAACKYDGVSFTHFTKKDGLPSNCVQDILEDKQGNIWFGCRVAEKDHPDPNRRKGNGGLARYNLSSDKKFIHFPEIEGLSNNDVYTVYSDESESLWIGATGHGLYRYDLGAGAANPAKGKFTLYDETDRMDLTARFGVQSVLEDKNGNIWLGFSGGLYRLEGTSIINITQGGPWP